MTHTVTAVAGTRQVTVTWSRHPDTWLYQIQRNIPSESSSYWETIAATVGEAGIDPAEPRRYIDTGRTAGVVVLYRIQAYTNTGPPHPLSTNIAIAVPFTTGVTAPSRPQSVQAETSDTSSIEVSWAAPASGGTATGYNIRYRQQGTSIWEIDADEGEDKTETTEYVLELDEDTAYQIQVQAYNTGGASAWTSSAVARTGAGDPPNPPISISAQANTIDDEITVRWSEDTSGQATSDAATSFDVRRREQGTQSWTTANFSAGETSPNARSYIETFTGLGYSKTFQFQVRARNANGSSDWAPSPPVTATTVPEDAISLTATAGENEVRLSWTGLLKPSNGLTASLVAGWNLERRDGASGSFSPRSGHTANARSFTDTGLTAGTQYFYRIRAHNTGSSGFSEYSNTASATPFDEVPGPVRSLGVLNIDGSPQITETQIGISWNIPNTGGPATSYEVEFKEQSESSWQTHSGSISIPAYAWTTITGLSAGTHYDIRVRAVNAVGHSTWADIRVETSTPPAPSIPTGVSLTTVDHDTLRAAWTAVTGATSYQGQYKKTAESSWTDISGDITSTHDIDSLDASTSYDFRVRATNAGGSSNYSSAASATTSTPPGPPRNVAASSLGGSGSHSDRTRGSTDSSIVVRWDHPNTGATRTGYQLRSRKQGTTTWSTRNIEEDEDHENVTSLEPGTTYEFQLRAVTASAQSDWTPSTPVTGQTTGTAGTGGNWQGLTATGAPGAVNLSWPRKRDNSNNYYTAYRVYRRTGTTGAFTAIGSSYPYTGQPSFQHSDTGRTNDTTYQYFVRANVAGGNATSDSNIVTATPRNVAPGPPTNIVLNAQGSTHIDVDWDLPDGATSTDIRWRVQGTTAWTETNWAGSGANQEFDIGEDGGTTALNPGTTYEVQLRARNSVGASAWKPDSPATHTTDTDVTAPTAPQLLTAALGNMQVALGWQAPSSTGGAAITRYEVRYKVAAAADTTYTVWSDAGADLAETITGLVNGTAYTFQVAAVNSAGRGASASVTATPRATAPIPWSTPIRLDAMSDLLAIFDRADTGDDEGAWTTNPSGTTTSANTGPGTNSDGPYVYAETSGGNIAATQMRDNSTLTVKTAVMATWTGTGRKFLVRTAIQGDGWRSAPEGFQIQGRASDADPWAEIELMHGWVYPPGAQYVAGGTVTDSDGDTVTFVQDGGWADFAINIPDAYTQVRIRLLPIFELDSYFAHDVAMWQVELQGGAAATAPEATTNLAATAGDEEVTLTWNDPSDDSITTYEFRQREQGAAWGAWTEIAGSGAATTQHIVTGLTNGTTYGFQVRAVNPTGNGPDGDEVTATPVAPTEPDPAPSPTGTVTWRKPTLILPPPQYTMRYPVAIRNRHGHDALRSGLYDAQPEWWSWTSQGGSDAAVVMVAVTQGPQGPALKHALDWLGHDVLIMAAGGHVVWSGYVNSVTVPAGDFGLRRSLDNYANDLRIKWTRPAGNGLGAVDFVHSAVNPQAAWQQARFGKWEVLVESDRTLADLSQEEVNELLAEHQNSLGTARMEGDIPAGARLECRGHAGILDRRYFTTRTAGAYGDVTTRDDSNYWEIVHRTDHNTPRHGELYQYADFNLNSGHNSEPRSPAWDQYLRSVRFAGVRRFKQEGGNDRQTFELGLFALGSGVQPGPELAPERVEVGHGTAYDVPLSSSQTIHIDWLADAGVYENGEFRRTNPLTKLLAGGWYFGIVDKSAVHATGFRFDRSTARYWPDGRNSGRLLVRRHGLNQEYEAQLDHLSFDCFAGVTAEGLARWLPTDPNLAQGVFKPHPVNAASGVYRAQVPMYYQGDETWRQPIDHLSYADRLCYSLDEKFLRFWQADGPDAEPVNWPGGGGANLGAFIGRRLMVEGEEFLLTGASFDAMTGQVDFSSPGKPSATVAGARLGNLR